MSTKDTATGEPWVPPIYPHERLAAMAERAAQVAGGLVDLSVGTPCDPPPDAVVEALARSRSERGYPPSVGSVALRQAASGWMKRRFEIDVSPDHVAACVGTKELVASLALVARLRQPERDTVLYPSVSYPTYALGASIAGCRAVAVPELGSGGPDLDAISSEDAERALVMWLCSPSNPTGAMTDLKAVARWASRHGVIVASDECYCELAWDPWPAPTILQQSGVNEQHGLLAVHSLSKRSNMAGLRVGFYAGDPELVAYLSTVRKHMGLMVPGPVQAAAVVALSDDDHVHVQRLRYRRRLEAVAAALALSGIEADLPAGGFYLWVKAPAWAQEVAGKAASAGGDGPSAGWVLAEALAQRCGVLVSPGEFYGPGGAGHVRIAMVAPDDVIDQVAQRIGQARLCEPR